jgi:type IV pilus assembly protein PilC
MKLYYRAVDTEGKSISGLIDARDVKEVAFYLRSHNMVPIKITPAADRVKFHIPFITKKPKLKDRIFFTSQLSSMLSSGLTLMQSLRIIRNQVQNPMMAEIVDDIILGVESGKVFSASLMKYPDLFPPIYISLVRSAESSGLLDKVLMKLAENLEKQDKLQRTIKGALTYPIVVVIVMILVVVIMMVFVIPQLSGLYANINVELPLSTKVVLAASGIFGKIWYLILIGGAVFIYYFRKWHKTTFGRRITDGYMLKMPIFGKLIMNTMMAESTRTLGLLIGAGSLVVDSLVRSSEVVDNVLYKDAILLISKRVEKGITMGDAMGATSLFPPMIVEMVKIGEQTGKLDESLIKSSEYFEREVDQTVKNLTTLLEPIIIVVLALGVGFLIFSIITPIYGLISSIQ